MLVALVDTNAVVSGVLSGGDCESATGSILDAMLAGTLRFVLSEVLLGEYRRVLLRAAIAERHRLAESEVDAILEELVVNASFRESAPLGDEHVFALLAVSPEVVLVTGDRRLRGAVASWREALAPAEFVARSRGC